jgi:asparagine synthase (glutamine-hydrolysing)
MCGIVGGFWTREPETLEHRFEECLESIRHRGPDDRGSFIHRDTFGAVALGMTRLSIIDLSCAGHQPMKSPDGRWTLVFNGEIYNYRELRRDLQAQGMTFTSDSDTEVLLAAWITWGQGCLTKLVGMFAFAIYDRDSGTIICVRDAFGIKPLYFAAENGSFVFASEMPTLLQLQPGNNRLNRQRAFDYLIFGVHDQDFDTFVAGVSHLPPAHLVRLSVREPGSLERWWKPRIDKSYELGFNAAAEELRELFLDTVKLHLRSDVPLGAMLSGGIDSSALVCAMRHLEPDMPIHTFSFIAADAVISEEKWVDIVNSRVGALVHKVFVNEEDLARDLPDLIRTQGEPFGSTNIYAQYRVFQAAREAGITVVLEGQGADELLAGYDGYGGQRMRSLFESFDIGGMVRFAREWKRWPGRENASAWRALVGQLLPDSLYAPGLRFANIDMNPPWINRHAFREDGISPRPNRSTRTAEGRRRRVVEVLSLALTEDSLPTLLRYGDRNAMRFSIENRVPYLTIPMADFVLGLPEEFLISPSGETKSVFRAAMRGIVPDEILDRRDKIGFDTPMKDWMSRFAPAIRERLGHARQFAFLNPEEMVVSFDAVSGQPQWNWQVWRMVNLIWWSQLHSLR